MYMKITTTCIISILLFSACHQEKNYHTTDFTDSVFTAGIEGPMYHADGNLYVVNYQQEGTIGKVGPDGSCELFVQLPEGSIGNSIRFDASGSMLVADYTGHNVLRIDMQTRHIEVWAHDSSMNQPNDLAVRKDGTAFCSDPNWAAGNGNLWKIDPKGRTELLMSNLGTTNGIELSPDEKYLYVNESVQRKIWRYDLNESGEVLNRILFYAFEDGGLDGMKCDPQGNLYIARYDKGTVCKVSPEGVLKKEYTLRGKKPTNLTFGGPEGKTVFVTMQDRGLLEKFELE